jgi:hypothetical protein
MPHRRDLKGVVHNFLGTYTSRYSDHEGWWIFGLAEAQLGNAQVDLFGSVDRADDPLSAATQMAQAKFAEQLSKAKIPSSFVREAHLSVTRAPELSRGQVNERWCDGHTFTFTVRVVSDRGKTFEDKTSIFVAPHDETIERRRTRAPNQALQLTDDRRVSTSNFYERVLDVIKARFRQR